jgi:hypothetical protein
MAGVTIEQMTTTSYRADLESLKVAGAYLPRQTAELWINYLAGALDDSASFQSRFNVNFEVRHDILHALAGLQLHLTEDQHRQLIQFALNLPEDSTQLLESSLRQILNSVTPAILDEHTDTIVSRGLSLPSGSWLGRVFVDLTALNNPDSREAASARIFSGSLGAISSGVTFDSLTVEEAGAIMAACVGQFSKDRDETNGVAIGGPDAYGLAAHMAAFGPEVAKPSSWAVVVEMITSGDVIHDRKTRALEFLASHSDLIPQEHRDALLRASDVLRRIQPSPLSGFDSLSLPPAGPAFAALYLELQTEDDDWQNAINALLSGTPRERRAAIEILARRSGHELLLLAMTRDADLEVAHSAMQGLARRAAEDASVARAMLPRLLDLVTFGGEQAALHIGRGIMATRVHTATIAPLVAVLQSHSSLQIRSLADALDNMGTPGESR